MKNSHLRASITQSLSSRTKNEGKSDFYNHSKYSKKKKLIVVKLGGLKF